MTVSFPVKLLSFQSVPMNESLSLLENKEVHIFQMIWDPEGRDIKFLTDTRYWTLTEFVPSSSRPALAMAKSLPKRTRRSRTGPWQRPSLTRSAWSVKSTGWVTPRYVLRLSRRLILPDPGVRTNLINGRRTRLLIKKWTVNFTWRADWLQLAFLQQKPFLIRWAPLVK